MFHAGLSFVTAPRFSQGVYTMPRSIPEPSADVLAAASSLGIEPPTAEDVAATIGAQVVLPPDSAAAMGAKGMLPTIEGNTLLRDAGYIQMGLDPSDPSGEHTDPDAPTEPEPEPTDPPVNVDVPLVTQSGATLNCTMGNWQGEPTSYAYAWEINAVTVGTDSPDYAVQAGDIGQTATCVVTATNAAGSTAAPPSNGVVVA
jgi:hypothetical protein